MEIKITVQLKPKELQLLDEALHLYIQHLEDGERIPIIGQEPTVCLMDARELLVTIGLQRRREANEYAVQASFLERT